MSRLFRTRADLVEVLRRAMPGQAPTVPQIDFAHGDLLLVAAGPRSSTGYAIRIVRVAEQRRRVLVVVRERTPSLGEPVEARVTYPYRLITFHDTGKPVSLHWQGRP